jgi:hypothetical protein
MRQDEVSLMDVQGFTVGQVEPFKLIGFFIVLQKIIIINPAFHKVEKLLFNRLFHAPKHKAAVACKDEAVACNQ